MWSILSVAAALVYAAAVSAVSTAGNRLLVVLDDVAEKDLYSQFLGDLTGAYLRRMLHRPPIDLIHALFVLLCCHTTIERLG